MKRITFINNATGTKMLVAENRKNEYLKADHKLATEKDKSNKADSASEKADPEISENKE